VKKITPASKYSSIKEVPDNWQEFTERTNWQKQRVLLRRCQAKRRNMDVQCNSIAVHEKSVCRIHGGGRKGRGTGNRTIEGTANQLAASTTHKQYTSAVVEKTRAINKTHRAITKLAVILGLQPNLNVCYPTPTPADIPKLLEDIKL
jgi:hypothetical protein